MMEQEESTSPRRFFTDANLAEWNTGIQVLKKKVNEILNQLDENNKRNLPAIWEELKSTINAIIKNPNTWESHCPLSMERYIDNDTFFSYLSEIIDEQELFNYYAIIYSFHYELSLRYSGEGSIPVMKVARDHPNIFPKSVLKNITYTHGLFTTEIFRSEIEKFKTGKDSSQNIWEQAVKDNQQNIETWKTQTTKLLNNKQIEVERLAGELRKYKEGFNFVCLYDGFAKFSRDKRRAGLIHLGVLFTLATLIICLLGWKIKTTNPPTDNLTKVIGLLSTTQEKEKQDQIQKVLDILNNKEVKEKQAELLNPYFIVKTIATISLLGVLIYFFRVVLVRYKEIQSEILQLELRKSLCSFIQGYGEYAKELKDTHEISLEKFENLIFSGIVSNTEKLPSTYDGMDVIAKTLNSIGPKK